MRIKPVLHRLLVKPDVLEEIDDTFKRARAAGIVTDVGQERGREEAAIDTGVVLEMGNRVFADFGSENTLNIGDRIIYARFGGKIVLDPDTKEKFVILNDEDVVAVITKGA